LFRFWNKIAIFQNVASLSDTSLDFGESVSETNENHSQDKPELRVLSHEEAVRLLQQPENLANRDAQKMLRHLHGLDKN